MSLKLGYFPLVARRKKSESAKELAQQIRQWLDSTDNQIDPNLNKLLQDLDNSENLEIWASLDPETYLPAWSGSKSSDQWNRINLLANIRNVMVFSPVALTWASISIATSSLTRYEQENPNKVSNFLQFWQQGYGYLNDFWKLSNVALLDVILVGIIIVLTFTIGTLTRKVTIAESSEEKKLQLARTSLILKIHDFFHDYKFPTASSINQNTYSATKSLVATTKTLSQILKRLEKDLGRLPDNRELIKNVKKLQQTLDKKQIK